STVPYGSPGNWSPVGLSGYAFLESPGVPDDHKDNDSDGLTDEKRNNNASTFIENPDQDPFLQIPFRDTTLFREFYGYAWRPHWDADENANWRSYFDINENGKWDKDEPLHDDVGADGIGPFDEGYTDPDFDGSEGNGIPDQGEPNFGILDKDESDQLGLTGFAIFPVHKYELNRDEENWQVLSALPEPHGSSLIGVNLANYFSSYLFSMNGRNTYSAETGENGEKGETERFSMALIFGINQNDLFRRKKTVQQIYNASYRFAKPPDKPILKAIAGDGRVTLSWDDRAEKTFDAFYQKYNFEGYRIYRSTESAFIENKIITDAYGKPTFRNPIAQFDLIDGIKGLHEIDVNGAKFHLGDDTGLRHSFIDETAQNGQTYYYAVSAYDQGFTTTTIEGEFLGIPPSETTTNFKIDIFGNISTDINTAVVTPRAPAAGHIPPEINSFSASGPGTGSLSIDILEPDSVKNNYTYRLEFSETTIYSNETQPLYSLIDYTTNDTLFKNVVMVSEEEQTFVKHGISLSIYNDTTVTVDFNNTEWIEGNSNYIVDVGFDSRFTSAYRGKKRDYPADFEIYLVEPGMGDTSLPATGFSKPIPSNIIIKNITEGINHFQFIFRDENEDEIFNAGDAIFLAFGDSLGKRAEGFSDAKVSWSISLVKDTTIAEEDQIHPEFGDIFRVSSKKPFRNGEYFQFTSTAQLFDRTLAVRELDNITVVPNPYVGAASWEPTSNTAGRGERRIFFTHLPSECTIRIYTLAGKHVETIEHYSTISDGQEAWNLVSKDGMDIAFGIYVYHVYAPGIGEKIGRLAIIK
ncbi:hypothetical protein ACFLS9_06380, partial [Bacteroidota bacterium]